MSTETEVRDALNEAATAAGLRLDPTVGPTDVSGLDGPFLTMRQAGGDGGVVTVVALRDGPDADSEFLETLALATTAGVIGAPTPSTADPVLNGAELVGLFDTPVGVTALTDGTDVQAVILRRDERRAEPDASAEPGPPGIQGDDDGDAATEEEPVTQTESAPAVTPAPSPPPAASPAPAPGSIPASMGGGLDKLVNVELGVSVELGRAHVTLSDVLEFDVGSIVELNRAAGAPVDIRVNGMLLAQGEVVLINDEYAVRITAIVDGQVDG
ncbi:MAG: flagellar motor switch protein FliN [Actinomycetota bacterium]